MSNNLTENQAVQKIQDLTNRANNLNKKIAGLSALKKQNEQELAQAEKRAIDEFGTSDLNELRKMYKDAVTEQTRAILQYEEKLNKSEAIVAQVESELETIDEKYSK